MTPRFPAKNISNIEPFLLYWPIRKLNSGWRQREWMPSTNPVFLWLFLAMRCVFDQKSCASLGQYIIRLTFVFLYFYFSQSSHLISKSYQSVFSIDKYHSISYKKITKSNYMSLQLHWNIHFVMSSRLFWQFYSYLQQKWCKLPQEVSCYYEEDIVGFWTPQYRKKNRQRPQYFNTESKVYVIPKPRSIW